MGEDWAVLHKGGKAGLYTVIVILSWWVRALTPEIPAFCAWKAVDDVQWVTNQISMKCASTGNKQLLPMEAFLERSSGIVVLNIQCGGELELTEGHMGDHLTSKGIAAQHTIPYMHQQNGKSEQYIHTLKEGGQALLADAGLPMSFWLDAVLTWQYLLNCLPTSALPENTTPFEAITNTSGNFKILLKST